MDKKKIKRKSHCEICGRRLSFKTPLGDIQWQSSHVDDDGIYCIPCYLNKDFSEKRKKEDPE